MTDEFQKPGSEPPEGGRTLWVVVRALEVGNWRAVLRPSGFLDGPVAGPGHLVRWAAALRLVARSQQLQAQGRLQDAWDRLSEAAKLLPRDLVRFDAATATAFAVLRSEPEESGPADVRLADTIARLVWREQVELLELKRRFAAGRTRARDDLIEGCVQFHLWVTFDPTTMYRAARGEPAWDDGVAVEPTRAVLCLFGTEVRWLADSTATTKVSQAPWQDIGGYRALCAEAFDLLAARPEPAPWCGRPGTSGLVVRCGRLRAWEHARRRREDLVSA